MRLQFAALHVSTSPQCRPIISWCASRVPNRWAVLAWTNFGLAVAAVLKFIPIVVSLAQDLVLSPQQAAAGMADERAWALDLISDTPYLLMVWFLIALWLRRQTGSFRLAPWRTAHRVPDEMS